MRQECPSVRCPGSEGKLLTSKVRVSHVGARLRRHDHASVDDRLRSARSEGIEVLGDGQLLDLWLERVNFG